MQQVGSIVQSVPFIAPIGAILSEFITVYKVGTVYHRIAAVLNFRRKSKIITGKGTHF
jgi:hypothetical protein